MSPPLPPLPLRRRKAQTIEIMPPIIKLTTLGYSKSQRIFGKKLCLVCWMGGSCLLEEVHLEGSTIKGATLNRQSTRPYLVEEFNLILLYNNTTCEFQHLKY